MPDGHDTRIASLAWVSSTIAYSQERIARSRKLLAETEHLIQRSPPAGDAPDETESTPPKR